MRHMTSLESGCERIQTQLTEVGSQWQGLSHNLHNFQDVMTKAVSVDDPHDLRLDLIEHKLTTIHTTFSDVVENILTVRSQVYLSSVEFGEMMTLFADEVQTANNHTLVFMCYSVLLDLAVQYTLDKLPKDIYCDPEYSKKSNPNIYQQDSYYTRNSYLPTGVTFRQPGGQGDFMDLYNTKYLYKNLVKKLLNKKIMKVKLSYTDQRSRDTRNKEHLYIKVSSESNKKTKTVGQQVITLKTHSVMSPSNGNTLDTLSLEQLQADKISALFHKDDPHPAVNMVNANLITALDNEKRLQTQYGK